MKTNLHTSLRRDRLGLCGSRIAGAALCLVVAACNAVPNPLTAVCTSASPYQGAPLRTSIRPADIKLTPGSPSSLTTTKINRLEMAFDTTRTATGADTLTAAVLQGGGGAWMQQHGAQRAKLHYWASVGKLVTSAAILRLAADGRVSLDDPVARFIADVPNGELITLRMLLSHTSGLASASASEDLALQSGPRTMNFPDEIAWLRKTGAVACPGANWRYSNSGYALLGGVIKTVTGKPYHVAASQLVLARSRAAHLRMISPDDPLRDMVPVGGRNGIPSFDPTTPQAAGGVIADAGSMAVFVQDLFSGRIFPHNGLKEVFADLYPMKDPGLWYGAGAMAYDVPGRNGTTLWLGHSGGVPGARAVVAYVPSKSAIVAVALTGNGSAEAVANLLLGAVAGSPLTAAMENGGHTTPPHER